MNALPLRRLWWRIEDRLPPRREWPAMVACYLLVAVPAAVGAGYVLAEWLVRL